MPSLDRYQVGGVTLLTDADLGGGVTFAFTERTGGVSEPPFSSLNLGSACGDDPDRVTKNRRRALAALGAEDLLERLVCPRQVHGDHVVVVRSGDDASLRAAGAEALAGADAVVCVAEDVPVLLCFADCVSIVLVAPGGFAVAHSGWRGTLAGIAGTTARSLASETGCSPADVTAYVGPHVAGADYEVSDELASRLSARFGPEVVCAPRHVDLARGVVASLAEAGVDPGRCVVSGASTARETDRFFSYRAEGGACGRHGAVALMRQRPWEWPSGARREKGARL